MNTNENRPLVSGGGDITTGSRASTPTVSPPATLAACPLCAENHDEIITHIVEAEVRRVPDGDLAAELVYTERELVDDPGQREPGLRHRLAALKDEAQRRQRISARGGPLYRGRTSIPQDQIAELKGRVNIADVIARDLPIAWIHGNRTTFRCPNHGDGHDRNPSLVAYEDEGRFWCFGCDSGGDVIDWMIARHGMTFRQAVEALS